jgi:lipopolysaccharide transport system permease protein
MFWVVGKEMGAQPMLVTHYSELIKVLCYNLKPCLKRWFLVRHYMAASSTPKPTSAQYVKIIEPPKRFQPLNLRELWQHREVLFLFTLRDIKIRYKQTILGILWAVIQPFVTMIVFSFIFGRVARMPSDGIPYPLFSYVGLLPWNFFSNGLNKASTVLVTSSQMIRKIYFPRMILPISAILSGLVDFLISFVMLGVLYIYYGINTPHVTLGLKAYTVSNPAFFESAFKAVTANYEITANIVWLPVLLLLAFLSALAVSFWLSALNVAFRDVGYALNFFLRMLLYLTPVIYPISALPESLRVIAALNPITGVVEGFRWAMLGVETTSLGSMLVLSTAATLVLLVTGAFYFRKAEATFADLV